MPTSATRSSDGVGHASLANASPATPSAAASGIPCTLPLGDVSGVLRSPCASIHSVAAGAVHLRHAAERADRDRVVAAEHERDRPAAARVLDQRRDALARALDRLEVARPRIADLGRLGQAHVHVAPVDALDAEARDPLLQPRVPDRARPHVDAAPAGTEVEPGADHGHRAAVRATHGTQANRAETRLDWLAAAR